MFKNDRMMMILTGLVLAIFAGSMVKYGDRIMGLMAGEDVVVSQDDSFSVRAGSAQVLDVLSNDTVSGPIVVLTRPRCGNVELTSANRLSFSSDNQCAGEVQFAYCVDVEGKCEPNAVRLNVITVNLGDQGAPATQTPTAQPENTMPVASATPTPDQAAEDTTPSAIEVANADDEADIGPIASSDAPAPNPSDQAPDLESFAIEMAPPSLASPSISELISPGVAVASIRRQATELSSGVSIDQNISTQNSAARAQTSGAAPDTFQPIDLGESSNISLGGGERTVASVAAVPMGLQSSPNVGSNIVQLERGPEALASLPTTQTSPVIQETAPLSSNPEVNNFAPVEVASAQTESPTLENSFSAEPIDGGPIALIALQHGNNNDAAGESLNLILTEPGEQSFAASQARPSALAPASDGPTAVSIMEREPNAAHVASELTAPTSEAAINVAIAPSIDRGIGRSTLLSLSALPHGAAFARLDAATVASQPAQVSSPLFNAPAITATRSTAVSPMIDPLSRASALAALTMPNGGVYGKPTINTAPAVIPEFLLARLPFTPGSQVITAPAQQLFCKINLEGEAISGANISLQINSACKAGQMATITHAGLAFSVRVNGQGITTVTFPAMEMDAEVTVAFEDQSSATTTVRVPEIESFVRAGVSWEAGMNLDLNAIEFGAAAGTEGYITPASPRDYRTSRIKGGGYLEQLGDPSIDGGALAEVYTLPVARNQQRGTIELAILIDDAESICGEAISAKTSRTREGLGAIIRNVRFNVPLCGTAFGQVVLPGAIDDIRVAGR